MAKTIVKCEGCGEETTTDHYDKTVKYWCSDTCFNKYILANGIKRVRQMDD